MARQAEVPGTERVVVKEINDAAEAYVEARDRRMRLTEQEVERRDALVHAMTKHGLKVYRDDSATPPLLVLLKDGKPSVKVTTADGADGTGGVDEADA